MENKKSGRWYLLLSAGLLVLSLAMVLRRSAPVATLRSDFVNGAFMGVAIGLILLALIQAKKRQSETSP